MTCPAVQRFVDWVPPPSSPREVDWAAAERELGIALPADYKELAERFGPGIFDDYIALWLPWPELPNADLVLCNEAIHRDLGWTGKMDGYVGWAMTTDGDVIAWPVATDRPSSDWPVAVFPRSETRWHLFEIGAVDFLYQVLRGTIGQDLFAPPEPPELPLAFTSWIITERGD